MIKTKITNGIGSNISAEVTEANALKVANVDYYDYIIGSNFFVNDLYGSDMAINASPSGTPDKVHNGIDDVYWTGVVIDGDWDFNSDTQSHTGTYSIDGTKVKNNHTCQFEKGSFINLNNYISISGSIYITTWPGISTRRLDLQGWNTGTMSGVGIVIDLGNYINKTNFNTWQHFVIPISDMSLTGESIDALRLIHTAGADKNLDFFLDDIQFESNIGNPPLEYKFVPPKGYITLVDTIGIIIVDLYDSILENATMPKLSYDKLLSHSFEIGMLYRMYRDEKVITSWPLKSHFDFLSFTGTQTKDPYSDGINTMFHGSIDFKYSLILDPRQLDYLSILIVEDFSVFKELKWSVLARLRRI